MDHPSKPRRLCFTFTCMLALGCAGAPTKRDAGDRYAQASQARDQGRLVDAEKAIAQDAANGSLQANLLMADIQILRGRHAEAVATLTPLTARYPKHPAIADLTARALDGAGLSTKAMAAYRHRLELTPGDARAATRLAQLLLGAGKAKAASAVAKKATMAHPKNAGLHALLARTLLARGRLPLALESARQATRLSPTSSATWLQLARVLTLAGELAPAADAYDKVLHIDAQHSAALVGLGGVRIEQRRWVKAAEILRRAVRVNPDNAAGWNALAVSLSRSGDHDRAVNALQKALVAAPGNRLLRRNLIEILLDAGRPSDAVEAADALARDPTTGKATAEIRQAERELQMRSLVARALANHQCSGGGRTAADLEATIARELSDRGMAHGPPDIAKVAAEVLPQVRAARARCRATPPAGGVSPGATP